MKRETWRKLALGLAVVLGVLVSVVAAFVAYVIVAVNQWGSAK